MAADMDRPSSIFEFLTAENPRVVQPELKNKNNTTSRKYHYPTQFRKWNEFNFGTLEKIFSGKLIQEARQARREELPAYPTIISETDCLITDEGITSELIAKWNKTIVNAALRPIRGPFQPTLWYSNSKDHGKVEATPPSSTTMKRKQPERMDDPPAKKSKKKSKHGFRPDSGAASPQITIPNDGGPISALPARERFPKEYKPARKWESGEALSDRWIKDGKWLPGRREKNYAMPIRQAYTYCVEYGCRYGCILTCAEAFIFRIQPLDKTPDADDPNVPGITLRQRLIRNGLLEYVSIPWENHHQGDVNKYRDLTINLALWFVHVLAGNNYQVDWNYGLLKDEGLAREPLPELSVGSASAEDTDEESDDSEATEPFERTPSGRKRAEHAEPDDEGLPHLSFVSEEGFSPLKPRRSTRRKK